MAAGAPQTILAPQNATDKRIGTHYRLVAWLVEQTVLVSLS
jgi:hypothetical protein